ncbi:MAG: 50S ribosomal protein L4, partial [Lachnospiraceae bacterium]|nr:50S ribosomal protein L4 [Lachnospiraceae bacterium]
VLDDLKLDEIKTKEFKKVLDALKVGKALVILDSLDRNVILSARNVPGVATAQAGSINTYDIMKYSTVVATKAAAEKIQEVYA